MPPTCNQCGAVLPDGAPYCTYCGMATTGYPPGQGPQQQGYQQNLQPYQQQYHQPGYGPDPYFAPRLPLSPMGVAGFVLGITGVVLYPLAILLGTLAIIFSAVALGSSKRPMYRSHWMAKWGLGLGIASICIFLFDIFWTLFSYSY